MKWRNNFSDLLSARRAIDIDPYSSSSRAVRYIVVFSKSTGIAQRLSRSTLLDTVDRLIVAFFYLHFLSPYINLTPQQWVVKILETNGVGECVSLVHAYLICTHWSWIRCYVLTLILAKPRISPCISSPSIRVWCWSWADSTNTCLNIWRHFYKWWTSFKSIMKEYQHGSKNSKRNTIEG